MLVIFLKGIRPTCITNGVLRDTIDSSEDVDAALGLERNCFIQLMGVSCAECRNCCLRLG